VLDSRTRVGQNEALFRQINEELEVLDRGVAALADNTLHIVCECGDLGCQERLVVAVDQYEAVRSDPALFFVVSGHEILSAEDIVERTDRYNIVRKHAGQPQRLAEATDPRA
jgi:hypothetical protein